MKSIRGDSKKNSFYQPSDAVTPNDMKTPDKDSHNPSSENQNWRKSSLFEDIPNIYLDQLDLELGEVQFAAGDYIVHEGEIGDCLYLIENGEVDISKEGIYLACKTTGEHFGAMALIDNSPRSADVIAKMDTSVKTLSVDTLKNLEQQKIYFQMLTNHMKHQQSLLRKMNQVAVQEMKAKLDVAQNRVRAGRFFVTLVFWLVLYQFLLGLFIEFSSVLRNKEYLDILNPSMMIIMGIAAYLKAYKSDFPLSSYGLNLYNWRSNLKQSLIWTGGFLVGLIFFKWMLTQLVPFYYGKPIIDLSIVDKYSFGTFGAHLCGLRYFGTCSRVHCERSNSDEFVPIIDWR